MLGATMKIAVTFFKLHDMQNAVYFDPATARFFRATNRLSLLRYASASA